MAVQADLVAYLDPLVAETTAAPTPSLVEGPMPELPDECVAVAHYASVSPEERVMGASLSDNAGLWTVLVQLMVRSASQTTAYSKAKTYFDLLDNLGPVTLSGRTYHNVEAEGEPFGIGQDGKGLWRVVCNYRVQKARG